MDVGAFLAKMDHFRPQAIGLTSKFVGGLILGRKKLGYGLQPETFFGAVVFVLPSPSGRARGFFDIGPWRALGRAANLPLP